MSSRRSLVLPVGLMVLGLGLLGTALWWAWQAEKRTVSVAVTPTAAPADTANQAVLYRPANADWWLVLGTDHASLAAPLAASVRRNIPELDPGTPELPAELPDPIAIAAAGPLRLWQFRAGTQILPPASPKTAGNNKTSNSHDTARWHVETLPDATVLFWLPGELTTTAVDRVERPPPGTGQVARRWLQQRLGWRDDSCEPLPALLAQLPEQALLQFDPAARELRWQLFWQNLPATLHAPLAKTGAPMAQGDTSDHWLWREADLSALPRPTGCPSGKAGAGFVARTWQQGEQWQAALVRPGQQDLAGFPLPLPDGVTLAPVMLGNGRALASGKLASDWLQQQSLLNDPGVLLSVQHRGGEFAGISLQLRSDSSGSLRMQWQWPLP